MQILAIDLGKFKSEAVIFDSETRKHFFKRISTTPQVIHDLLIEHEPDRLVIEISNIAGWICDLAEDLGVPCMVANPNHEGWRWNRVKRKTDKDDALKLARLAAADDLPMVTVPCKSTRQWRSLIKYRNTIHERINAIKNSIRALVASQGLSMPVGQSAWTIKYRPTLRGLAADLVDLQKDELWRGQLQAELDALEHCDSLLVQVETKLNAIGRKNTDVQRLARIKGIGDRTAEAVVAYLDNPKRFKNARQVGSYAGLTPKQFESGMMKRQGRISGEGSGLLRKLLVNVAWGMERRNPYVAHLFKRITRGHKPRRKQAAVAVARKLLVWMWAMLRDGTEYQMPSCPAI